MDHGAGCLFCSFFVYIVIGPLYRRQKSASMNRLLQKPAFRYIAAALFLMVVTAAVLWQYWWLLVLPVVLLFYVWTIEKPILLFYLLMASLPWSVEYKATATLGTDFPDEPLMLLNALTA